MKRRLSKSQGNFSTEYAYDRHANLTRLKKYGLVEPTTGEFGLIDDLHISYDGNQAVRVEDFADELVYEGAGGFNAPDGVGEMVMHPYGYFDGEGKIRYYLHDFQGNVTMVVDGDGEVLQHSRYYPYGEAIDVFAASQVGSGASVADRAQPYLYGGKELERMHGLGEYDYGARRLQSHLPMWTTQDPCLEKYFPTSPYAYCAGNPIRFTDPDGKEARVFGDYSKQYIKELQKAAPNLKLKLKDGKISVKVKNNKELSETENRFITAVESQDHILDIYTTSDNITAEGRVFVGGAQMGVKLSGEGESRKATATQLVNPEILRKMSEIFGKKGIDAIHEFFECYEGADIALKNNENTKPAIDDNDPKYLEAHYRSTPQSGAFEILYYAGSNVLTSPEGATSCIAFAILNNDQTEMIFMISFDNKLFNSK